MNPIIAQINVKSKNNDGIGLPKYRIKKSKLNFNGFEDDYNHFRFKKKNTDPKMSLLMISFDLLENFNQNGWPVKPGDLGENLTLKNINYSSIRPNQQYQIGNTKIEITFKCDPCQKLRFLPYVGNSKINEFIKFLIDNRGWYAKVIETGIIHENDSFELINK